MGLTIHFSFRAPPQTDAEAALEHVQRLHGFCEDRPFAEVLPCKHSVLLYGLGLVGPRIPTLRSPRRRAGAGRGGERRAHRRAGKSQLIQAAMDCAGLPLEVLEYRHCQKDTWHDDGQCCKCRTEYPPKVRQVDRLEWVG